MATASPQLDTDFQPLLFNSLGSRQVVTDFSAGHLSSDGGMLLLRQIDEGLGISRSLAACFSDLRSPLLIEHSVRELVAQRLLGLAAGYEDLNDHSLLRLDPLVRWQPISGNGGHDNYGRGEKVSERKVKEIGVLCVASSCGGLGCCA